MRKGFGLLVVIVAVAIAALIAGGSFYLGRKSTSPDELAPQVANDLVQQAKDAADAVQSSTTVAQTIINRIESSTAGLIKTSSTTAR